MRDALQWGVAVVFLLAAFYTVHVRREVYRLGREIGVLQEALTEQSRRADNLQVELERLESPARLKRRMERLAEEPK
jgi:cell division protein FtsL